MPFARHLIRNHAAAALLLAVLALFVRALVPAGYMPGTGQDRVFDVRLCSSTPGVRMVQLAIPADANAQPGKALGGAGEHGGADKPCAFAGLGLTALGSVDGPIMAPNMRHILLLGLAPITGAFLAGRAAVPPPSTGPPANR